MGSSGGCFVRRGFELCPRWGASHSSANCLSPVVHVHLTTGVMFGQFGRVHNVLPSPPANIRPMASTGKPRYGLQGPDVSVFRFGPPSSSRHVERGGVDFERGNGSLLIWFPSTAAR